MAFKMKNPSVMKMAKEAGKGSPMKKDTKKQLADMAKKQKVKYGDPGKDAFGLDYLDAERSVKSGVGSYTYKNMSYATRKDMLNAIRKDNPDSSALPENKGKGKKRKIKEKSVFKKDADKKRRKRKALKSVEKGNYKNTLERAMDIKYNFNIGPESGADSKRKTKERK